MTAKRFCNGVTRRDFLHLGAAGVFGLGLNLPTILQAQERARARGQQTRAMCRSSSCSCTAA